jgi:hypothetical protein
LRPSTASDSNFTSSVCAPSASVVASLTIRIGVRWLGRFTPAWLVTRPDCARYSRFGLWSNRTMLRLRSTLSRWRSSSKPRSVAPVLSKVAFTTSVVMVTRAVGAAAGALGTPAGAAPAAAGTAATLAGAGTALGSVAGAAAGVGPEAAVAAGRGDGLNIEGCPLCLFQASQSSTRDMAKTVQSRVRRMSFMAGFRWKSRRRGGK